MTDPIIATTTDIETVIANNNEGKLNEKGRPVNINICETNRRATQMPRIWILYFWNKKKKEKWKNEGMDIERKRKEKQTRRKKEEKKEKVINKYQTW